MSAFPAPACVPRPALSVRLLPFALALLLAACASSPPEAPSSPAPTMTRAPSAEAPARPPEAVARQPDASPRVEPVRAGGANRPYKVAGQTIVPMTEDLPFSEKGSASWYGKRFHGRPTASGEPYDMHAMTAAHRTLPLPSYVRVRNLENGREIIVRVNDRGPMGANHVIDLSYAAAAKLGALKGSTQVEVERLTNSEIRTGAWKQPRKAAPEAPTRVAERKPAPAAARQEPVLPAVGAASIAQVQIDDAGDAQIPPIGSVAELPAGDQLLPESAAQTEADRPALTAADGKVWLQLGPFRDRPAAEQQMEQLRLELGELLPGLELDGQGKASKLKAGPYASREAAQAVARRVALRGVKPMLMVQR